MKVLSNIFSILVRDPDQGYEFKVEGTFESEGIPQFGFMSIDIISAKMLSKCGKFEFKMTNIAKKLGFLSKIEELVKIEILDGYILNQ